VKKLIVLIAVIGASALPAIATAQTEEPPPGVARVGHVEGMTQFRWQGPNAVGTNTTPFTGDIACGADQTDPTTICDVSLVEFSYPLTQAEIDAGRTSHTKSGLISIRNGGPFPDPPTDLDLQVLESDANGTPGAEVGVSGAIDADWAAESVPVTVRTTPTQPSKWFLVRVIYFASAGNSYLGQAGFDLPAGIDDGATLAPTESFEWDGQSSAGMNANYFGLVDGGDAPPYPEQVPDELPPPPVWTQDVTGEMGTCSKDPNTYCEQYLFEYSNPLTPEEIEAGVLNKKQRSTVTVDWASGVAAEGVDAGAAVDFDLQIFQSDQTGTIGTPIGESTQGTTTFETVEHTVTTTAETPSVFVVVRIIYWTAPASSYNGTVTF
jgi:hypothetical protein